MTRTLPVTLGALMFVFGSVFTFQGLGYLEGSPMTDSTFWAIVGPMIAGLGVGFFLAGLKRGR
ncbi:MAG: hypothetical protein WBQ50_14120 [Nocardioides sp.]